VLVGVWIPKRWDLSLNAVAQYTIPRVPAENEWIDRSKIRPRRTPSAAAVSEASITSPSPAPDSRQSRKRRRPPTRRLIRHVLRARVEAAKALASLFEQLEKSSSVKRVCASVHLARAFGGQVEEQPLQTDTDSGVESMPEPIGWRSAREVIKFLRKRGAKIAELEERIEGDWAALSSDGEGDSDTVALEGDRGSNLVWIPTGQ